MSRKTAPGNRPSAAAHAPARRSNRPRIIVGVDVGGTYTDIFALDEATGQIRIGKVPSTRDDPSRAFIEGIETVAGEPAGIATIVHGTTVGTNALLERKLARTAVISTTGFRDVLEMRRRDRPSTWGLWGRFEPIVPRDLRREVDERTLADGSVRTPVDLAAIRRITLELIDDGVQAVCLFFINSYANPANEAAAAALVRELWPNAHVSVSSEILPEIREFERASTAAINASLQPVVGDYLQSLEATLRERGFGGEVLIVQSNGGVMSIDTARALPVRTALSGPAAGVIACAHLARAAGFPDLITGDMGGTSFDVALVEAGQSALAAQTSVGFGMVVRTPMIQIETIGAGGGSIARVDASGLLQVGPESAGAFPGPVCYGQGNREPTVTDANVLLGRINPERPIGDRPRLDVDAAREAIERCIARPLGLEVMAAAEAILQVANAHMAGAVRLVSVERGHDPKRFAYMPFGGGGALHVCAMMREVGVTTGIVPRYPGVTSALGCVIADMRHDHVQTINAGLAQLDLDALQAAIRLRADEGRSLIATAAVRFRRIDVQIELDMLYAGQTHTLAVPVTLADTRSRARIARAFEARYRSAFGQPLAGIDLRVLNLRVAVIGRRQTFDPALLAPSGKPAGRRQDPSRDAPHRRVWIGRDWQSVPVLDRLALPRGTRIAGPALFEQADTTIWLEPGMQAQVDALGNLIITRIPGG
jgi:N-methylhydantoinase A